MEDVKVSDLAAALRAASEEEPWNPEDAADPDGYYRRVALRVQGNLRKTGAIGRIDKTTRDSVMAALGRVKADSAAAV